MSTSTNVVEISDAAYVDVSTGNLNCALMVKYGQKLRVNAADNSGVAPDPDTEEYFNISGGPDEFQGSRLVMSFNNLVGEDRIWIRAESGQDSIKVVRGEMTLSGNR